MRSPTIFIIIVLNLIVITGRYVFTTLTGEDLPVSKNILEPMIDVMLTLATLKVLRVL